jgi:hypothetical protein
LSTAQLHVVDRANAFADKVKIWHGLSAVFGFTADCCADNPMTS